MSCRDPSGNLLIPPENDFLPSRRTLSISVRLVTETNGPCQVSHVAMGQLINCHGGSENFLGVKPPI